MNQFLALAIVGALLAAILYVGARAINAEHRVEVTQPRYVCPDGYVKVAGWSFGSEPQCVPGMPATKVR